MASYKWRVKGHISKADQKKRDQQRKRILALADRRIAELEAERELLLSRLCCIQKELGETYTAKARLSR